MRFAPALTRSRAASWRRRCATGRRRRSAARRASASRATPGRGKSVCPPTSATPTESAGKVGTFSFFPVDWLARLL